MQRTALALDIGGTKIAAAIVREDGCVLVHQSAPTHTARGSEDVIRRLFDLGKGIIELNGAGRIEAVGVSCGGPINAANGVLVAPLHLPGWIDVPIVQMARHEFGVPTVLENDASAGALAEHRHGSAKGADVALYLTISTGVGGGAVVNGQLYRGAAGNGGEYGHLTVRHRGLQCSCGRLGCLEAYVSGTSIAARATSSVAINQAQSLLSELPQIRAEDVVAATLAGDQLATMIWDETTEILGQALTDLANLFEPNVIVLGGGVTKAGKHLLNPVRRVVKRDAMPPAAAAVSVELSQLGDLVCLVGAAVAALDHTN